MTNNLTLTDVNMTQAHGLKSTMPTNVLDGQILIGREQGNPTEAFSGTSKSIELLSNSNWKNIHGETGDNNKLVDALYSSNAYLSDGKLLYDKQGLNDVEYYAHSTFDLSKFTVVGSPNITDGVLSNITNNNYVKFTKPSDFDISDFEITVKKQPGKSGIYLNTNTSRFLLWVPTQNYIKLVFRNNSNAEIVNYESGSTSKAGTSEFVTFKRKNGVVTAFLDGEEVALTETINSGHTLDEIETISFSEFYVGKYGTGNNFGGYLDLKYLSMKCKDAEVFSGNKTDIDTIKPDDYTVVGTPMISADGIASGFGENDYITSDIMISPTSSLDMFISFHIPETLTSNSARVLCMKNGNQEVLALNLNKTTGNHYYQFPFGTTSINNIHGWGSGGTVNYGKDVEFWFSWNGSEYTIKKSLDAGQTWNNVYSAINSTVAFNASTLRLGQAYTNLSTAYYEGSIDLNTFKIYVDGNLIYQPCLKIPYTESKTGSKVVNYIYRDRVQDAYEQDFEENYYTLQESQINNYNKIGSLSITNDIASLFNNSNYAFCDIMPITLDKLNIYGSFTTVSNFSNSQYIFAIAKDSTNNNSLVRMAIDSNKRLGIGCHNNTTWTAYWSDNNYIESNKTYLYHCYYENGHIKLDVSIDSLTYVNIINQSITVSSSYKFGKIWLGSTGANNDTYFRGSIDLSKFIQYVNKKEAAKLLIKPNFTVPDGEIYGMIEQRVKQSELFETDSIIYFHKAGTEWERVWSNGWCEQAGAKAFLGPTTNQSVDFIYDYVDTTYMLQVSTSDVSGTTVNGAGIGWGLKTPSGFKFGVGEGYSADQVMNWYACGFIDIEAFNASL